jgi:hypothetical protein
MIYQLSAIIPISPIGFFSLLTLSNSKNIKILITNVKKLIDVIIKGSKKYV